MRHMCFSLERPPAEEQGVNRSPEQLQQADDHGDSQRYTGHGGDYHEGISPNRQDARWLVPEAAGKLAARKTIREMIRLTDLAEWGPIDGEVGGEFLEDVTREEELPEDSPDADSHHELRLGVCLPEQSRQTQADPKLEG